MTSIFEYQSQYRVIICLEHQYAIEKINIHLRDFHRLSKERRKELTETYSSLERVEPRHVQSPPPGGPPIEVLGLPVKAFACQHHDCDFISTSEDWIRKHAYTHGWRVSESRPVYWRGVQAQTFFRNPRLIKYFLVRPKLEEDTGTSTPHQRRLSHSRARSQASSSSRFAIDSSLSGRQQQDLQQLEDRAITLRQRHEEEMQVQEKEVLMQDRTGWWALTKWPEHFGEAHKQHLAHASRVPDRDEHRLQRAVKICNVMLVRAVRGLGTLHRETRCWLRSAKHMEPDGRPLARLENPESQERYFNYWRRCICYCLRVHFSQQEMDNQEGESVGETTTDDSDDEDGDAESEGDDDNDGNVVGSRPTPPQLTNLMKDACRLFIWTPEQTTTIEKLSEILETEWDEEDESQTEQMVACMLDFCRTLIFFQFAGSEFESGLVHFCAVLAIDEEAKKLRRASDYSYMVAGVIYCARILAAEMLLPASEREEQKRVEVRENFLEQRRRWLTSGSGTPMSTLLTWLAYGKYIALNTGNAGAVAWSKDKQVLIYRGFRMELSLFRRMIQQGIADAEEMLWIELMWVTEQSQRFTVSLDHIEDDVVFTRRGYSFISRASNQLDDQGQWMRERMIRVLEGARRLYINGRWRRGAVQRWLRRCDRFLELLLFCIHTTWGQPARGTEVTALRFRNGSLQDRNVFVIDGAVVLVTRYHKSQSQFDRPKVIPRFLPPKVAQLLVIYLVYVQPFREHLRLEVNQGDFSDFIWHDDKGMWETPRLRQIIQRQTSLALGHAFGVLDYRHIAVSVGRVIIGETWAAGYKDETGEIEEAEVDEESGLELQSGRGELQGTLKYGVPVDIVNHLSVRSLETFRPLSERWHLFLGLLDVDVQRSGRSTEHRASSSSKRAADTEHQDAEERGRSRSRHGSGPAWRRLFSQRSSTRSQPLAQTTMLSSSPPREALQSLSQHQEWLGYRQYNEDRQPRLSYSSATIMTALRQILRNEHAEFRSTEQRDAMFAILRGETPLVVVLPTGGGKTLLAMLPTQLDSEGVTIFVAPFRALVNDMVLRFGQNGIDTMEWRHGEANPARLVVVSADIAANFGFINYCQSLQRKGLLRAIFFDEIHLVVTANDWRPSLDHLQELRTIPCIQVFLTATLPPTKAVTLEVNLGLHSPRYIRASTSRIHHRYLVQRCKPKDLTEEAIRLAQRQQQHFALLEKGRKGIVYCRSRSLCEQLARELKCLYYHAADIERSDRLIQWVEQGGLIVATSALGTGVDFQSIVWTLHVDLPWSMIDFAQESGRAGRGGEIVDAVILAPEHRAEQMMQEAGLRGEQSAMAHFVGTRDCRRQVMSAYLDGLELAQSCEEIVGVARCDRCGEGMTALPEKKRRAIRQREIVESYLDRMTTGCTLCFMQNSENEEAWQTHTLLQCPQGWPQQSEAELDRFRAQIRYDTSSHTCHRCGISQRLCRTGEDASMACQWPQVLVPIMVAAYSRAEGLATLRNVGCGDHLESTQTFTRWLGRRYERQIWQIWMSNAMAVMIRLILNDHEQGEIERSGDVDKALYDCLEDEVEE